MSLGLKSKTVKLLPNDHEWKNLYYLEKSKIEKLIGDKIISIEHVGSTAIKTICAKPIIDIAISLRKHEDGFECINLIESLGYVYRGECGIQGRYFFRTDDEIVKFHIHMFEVTSLEWENQILFRDYLIENKDIAKKYQELKIKLMNVCFGNRDLYTERKGQFISETIEKARMQMK